MLFRRSQPEVLGALVVAAAASFALLVLSFTRIWGDLGSAAFGGKIIEATMNQPLWGTALAWNLAGFVVSLVVAHALLGTTALGLALASSIAWPQLRSSLRAHTLLWFMMLSVWILIANAAWFPMSSLGGPYASAVTASVYGICVFSVATACLCTAIGSTVVTALVRRLPRARARLGWFGIATIGTIAGVLSFGVPEESVPATGDKPHVIVIGLDSLRVDAVGARAGEPTLTPAIDRFLSNAAIFTDTLTPLARTFPAWVSIISGKHPHTTGAVMNLLPRELIDEGDTLPKLLKRAGYNTIYATDEVRFSNLDQTFGFESLIAPPMGSADFLLGFFADVPLANILVNTRVGRYLFPYAHANRAAATVYEPETFVERLDAELELDRPTFLAMHLTLVHWPYTWASASAEPTDDVREKYEQALKELNDQFDDILQLLEERGALENAIVVVLSDHGESLGETASVPNYDAHLLDPEDSEVFGHGTNVFADGQYRVILAMRSYGAARFPAATRRELPMPVTLEDLAPTLTDALSLRPTEPFDGKSWFGALRGEPLEPAQLQRIRYMETEFNPPGFTPGEWRQESAVMGGAKYYRIDAETDRVLVRSEYLDEILTNRQYAALRGSELLASIPSRDQRTQHLVYADLDRDVVRWLESPPQKDADSQLSELWAGLSSRFEPVQNRPVTPPPADK